MPNFANTTVPPPTGGRPYCTNALLPAAEGELYNVVPPMPQGAPPVDTPYESAGLASVVFTVVGGPLASNLSYVVWQGDLGDGVWLDLAWCTFTGLSGTATFFLSVGAYQANAVQQSRAVGTAPSPSLGAVQTTLPDRLRFVGKGGVSASSSSSSARASPSPAPGVSPGVQVTVRYKLLGLR